MKSQRDKNIKHQRHKTLNTENSEQTGEGFTTIMDTVETTLGAPTAEEMAAGNLKEAPPTEDIPRGPETSEEDKEPSSKSSDSDKKTDKDSGSSPADSVKEEAPPIASKEEAPPTASGGGGGWFSGWGVSSLSSVMQNTTNMSKHLVTGSLDVLETIGKKTFDVIKEHDPVLRKTREVFLFDKGDKPNLSQVLRDAKKDSEAQVELEHQMEEARKVNFGAVFDEYQGLAHLEALEILSNQCEKRIQSLLSAMSEESLADIKSGLIDIKKVFEREEEEDDEVEQNQDFEKLVTEEISKLHLGTKPDKLTMTHKNIKEKLENCETGSDDTDRVKSLHQCAIQSLAELTSKSVEQFHKAGELVLLQREPIKTFLEKAYHLHR
ncbi:hypothetical protein FSP39_007841 [Pinctada imbricata]|uniref:Protein FAM114A2 n=1 Tax=Pinctada imbricata TaxID=66713 RepID=A0AA88Y7V0_PINIB|nr:hypothetical protein FSP39_007841 [Pinctada imbricata]